MNISEEKRVIERLLAAYLANGKRHMLLKVSEENYYDVHKTLKKEAKSLEEDIPEYKKRMQNVGVSLKNQESGVKERQRKIEVLREMSNVFLEANKNLQTT